MGPVTTPLLVLELNELCPPLLDRFMAEGMLPNFCRLRSGSVVAVTDAGEPQDHLNPWIQWVTAHTGVGFDEHRVFKLGEGARSGLPTVADVVAEHGGSSWLCSPMNVVPQGSVRGAWLPDPWNPDADPEPPELRPFAEFVRANVQEHSNRAHRMDRSAVARFARFMLGHGARPASVASIIRQLLGERVGGQRWKRAALLDRVQWDVFSWYHRNLRPDFATYFSNTTAHYQHSYWRYMDPAPFVLQPTAEELARYGDAVAFGYREMDRIVGAAIDLAGDDTTLVLCTALSQQPYTLAEDAGGNRFHRPRDVVDLFERMGIEGITSISPVMSCQFHVYFDSDRSAAAGAEVLAGATVAGAPAFDVRVTGNDVFTGCAIVTAVPAGSSLVVGGATERRLDFHQHLYQAETPKSGYHHPEGALWMRSPLLEPCELPGTVPLRAVAPTFLDLLGLPPAPTMRTPALSLRSAR